MLFFPLLLDIGFSSAEKDHVVIWVFMLLLIIWSMTQIFMYPHQGSEENVISPTFLVIFKLLSWVCVLGLNGFITFLKKLTSE